MTCPTKAMTTNGLEQGVMEIFSNYKHNEIRKDISKLFTISLIINDIYHWFKFHLF
jgi:hypothetical protein